MQAAGELAITLGQTGRLDDALEVLDEAVDRSGDDAWLLANRAIARGLSGQFEQSIEDFDRAVTLSPDDPQLLASRAETKRAMGRLEEAAEDFTNALRMDEDGMIGVLVGRGEIFKEIGDFDLAMADFNAVISRDPDNPEAYGCRGEVHRIQGRHDLSLIHI